MPTTLKTGTCFHPVARIGLWLCWIVSGVGIFLPAGEDAGSPNGTPICTAQMLYDAVDVRDTAKIQTILRTQKDLIDEVVKPESSPYTTLENPIGLTPFLAAILADDVEILRIFRESGANMNYPIGKKYGSILIFSINWQKFAAARFLVEHKTDLTARDENGYTALFWASYPDEDLGFVRFLLAHGADANERDAIGWTPLVRAAQDKNLELLELLLVQGADIRTVDNDGNSLLAHGITLPNDRLGREKRFALADRLLALGLDINATNKYGNTVLLDAVMWGDREAAEYLIANGINPWHLDKDGQQCIHFLTLYCLARNSETYALNLVYEDGLFDYLGTFRVLYAVQVDGVNRTLWLLFLALIPGMALWLWWRGRNHRPSTADLQALEAHRDALSALPQWRTALPDFEKCETARLHLHTVRTGLAVPALAWCFGLVLYFIDPLLNGLYQSVTGAWYLIGGMSIANFLCFGSMWIDRPKFRIATADLGMVAAVVAALFILRDSYFTGVQLRFFALGGLLTLCALTLLTAIFLFWRIRRADLILLQGQHLSTVAAVLRSTAGEDLSVGAQWDAVKRKGRRGE